MAYQQKKSPFPAIFGVIAVLLLGGAFLAKHALEEGWISHHEMKAIVPPDAVALAQFDPAKDVAASGDATVVARPVADAAELLIRSEGGGFTFAYFVPLAPVGSDGVEDIRAVALFDAEGFAPGDVTPQLMLGAEGPDATGATVSVYQGPLGDLGVWQGDVLSKLAMLGVTNPTTLHVMRPNPVAYEPALTGVQAQIADVLALIEARGLTLFQVLSLGAAGFAGLALLSVLLRSLFGGGSARRQDPLDRLAREAAGLNAPAQAQRAASTSARPPAENPAPTPAPARSSGGFLTRLRNGVIGMIVAALLGVAGLAGWDMYEAQRGASAPVQAAQQSQQAQQSPQEASAAAVADALIPDADPDRHWTEIDITPYVEWVTAKALLAQSGDREAQMAFALVGGGLLLLLFCLFLFLKLRRLSQPKTVARVDAMGL